MIYVYNISLEKNHMISYSYILNYYIQIYTTVLFCLPWEVDTIRWLPLQPRDSIQKKQAMLSILTLLFAWNPIHAIHPDGLLCTRLAVWSGGAARRASHSVAKEKQQHSSLKRPWSCMFSTFDDVYPSFLKCILGCRGYPISCGR